MRKASRAGEHIPGLNLEIQSRDSRHHLIIVPTVVHATDFLSHAMCKAQAIANSNEWSR